METKDNSLRLDKGEISVRGKPVRVDSARVGDKIVTISGSLFKMARIEEEWYEDVEDPESLIRALRQADLKADIFTFWQRLPENEPRYNYFMEWESIAALPIKSFDYWWKNQVNAKTRNLVRKAEKMGVVVKQVDFDDEFIKGMTDIFNETPIRQGKPFWHYGKDFETVKREFSRYLHREDLIGAYLNNDLIGFIFLAYAGKYAMLGQIVSKIEHRDKAPNNALIAKAVEICENKGIPYLVYAMWIRGSLGDFKRHNGFKKMDLPRYYCPLNYKGTIALRLNLHRGVRGIIPEKLKARLIGLRKRWFARRYGLQESGRARLN